MKSAVQEDPHADSSQTFSCRRSSCRRHADAHRRRRRCRSDASRDHERTARDPQPDGCPPPQRRGRSSGAGRSRSIGRPRSRRSPGDAGDLSRADRAVREAQGRARPDPRRHQPHQAGNRGSARQELQRRGNGPRQRRARRRGRRHRGSHPANSGSRRVDRPGRQRADQGEFARSAEAAQRGNPGKAWSRSSRPAISRI